MQSIGKNTLNNLWNMYEPDIACLLSSLARPTSSANIEKPTTLKYKVVMMKQNEINKTHVMKKVCGDWNPIDIFFDWNCSNDFFAFIPTTKLKNNPPIANAKIPRVNSNVTE